MSMRRTGVILALRPRAFEAMKQVLEKAGLEVVGWATSDETAAELIAERAPDLLVLENDAPERCEFVRRARALHPRIKVIVVSSNDEQRLVDMAFAEGASAYCLKSAAPDDFAAAIRQSFENSIYLANRRGDRLVERGAGTNGEPATVKLTRREREILRLVADGYSNAHLARMLWVTEQTVKFHLSNIYRKLNVSNRTEASRWAHIHGFLTPSAESGDGTWSPHSGRRSKSVGVGAAQ
jgi:DNA-binding NarL/FixJ family response regulator